MNLLELIDKRKQATAKLEGIITNAKSVEKRTFSDDEKHEFAEIELEIENIDKEINERSNKNINTKQINKEIMNKEFRLLDVIRETVEGRNYSDASNVLIEAGKEEMRKAGHNVSVNSVPIPFEMRAISGSDAVDNVVFDILQPLKNLLVFTQAGAEFMTGLTGNGALVLCEEAKAYWKGEVKGTDTDNFSRVEIKPKFISAVTTVDRQWLTQTSQSVEGMIRTRIIDAIAQKIESTILGNGIGSENIPSGILGGISSAKKPSVNGVVTFDKVVALESSVAAKNALGANPVYITTAVGRGSLKVSNKSANGEVKICELGEVNGYKLLVTNNIPTVDLGTGAEQPVIFGNFSDLVIAQWGGLELIIDPYTKASDGQIVVTVSGLFDVARKHNESFAIGTIK